jgi:antirestriction protein ArdC
MLMLHCEKMGYQLPVFATFQRVAGLNYSRAEDGSMHQLVDAQGEPLPRVTVKKGEQSFPVMLTTHTVVHRETHEKIKLEEWKLLTPEEREEYNVYTKQQVFNVFCVEQTNLKEARPEMYAKLLEQNMVEDRPEVLNGEEYSFAPIDVMIERGLGFCPVSLEYQDRAFYSLKTKSITMPEKRQFVDGESFYGTFLHEATHNQQDRLGLLKPSVFGDNQYAKSELEAELTSALICQRLGISKTIKAESAAYLKSWLESLNESPDFLKSILANVKRESAALTQRIDLIQSKLDSNERVETLADLGIEEETEESAELTALEKPELVEADKEAAVTAGRWRMGR